MSHLYDEYSTNTKLFVVASFDNLSDIELGKGNTPEALTLTNSPLLKTAAPVSSSSASSSSPSSGKKHLDDGIAELYAEPDSPTSERHQLLSSRNSSSFELPRFGRWYSRGRDIIPIRLRLQKQVRGLNIKLLLVIFFLTSGFIFTVVSVRRKLGHSCWTWKGKIGGGPCNQFTKPGEDDEFWWERKKKEEPEKKIANLVAVPDFALKYGMLNQTKT